MSVDNTNELLRQARKRKNWSQSELAEQLGVSVLTIGRWERGEAAPSERNRRDLCRIFAVEPHALGFLLEKEEPSPPPAITRSVVTPPRPEHPSTYFVQDRTNSDEMTRLTIQDRMMTAAQGGVLPELSDPAVYRRILDVGCGTGGWLRETARMYPTIPQLIGVDISSTMLAYAREQAEQEHLSDRIQFLSMDALRMLEFANDYFDLANLRFGLSYLRIWDWPKMIQELKRVARLVRVTEVNAVPQTNSRAFNEIGHLTIRAFHQAGHISTPDRLSLLQDLPGLMSRHVYPLRTTEHSLLIRTGTPEHRHFVSDMELGLRTGTPFLRRWLVLPEDYDSLCQQMIEDMWRDDFTAEINLLTVLGSASRPLPGETLV